MLVYTSLRSMVIQRLTYSVSVSPPYIFDTSASGAGVDVREIVGLGERVFTSTVATLAPDFFCWRLFNCN